jgi:hypothetical protein
MDFSKESYTATKHFEDIGRMPIGLGATNHLSSRLIVKIFVQARRGGGAYLQR